MAEKGRRVALRRQMQTKRFQKADIATLAVNLPSFVRGIELMGQRARRLTRSQEKKTARDQTKMEQRQNAILRGRLEIDEKVPARDQMHFCERGIFCDVMWSEDDQLPEVL